MVERKMNRDFDQDIIRYPDPAVEVLDASFRPYVLGNAALERLWTGARWTEGPVWFGGVKRNRLFITAGQSLYSIYTDAQGMPYQACQDT